jgi:hypothetical protein
MPVSFDQIVDAFSIMWCVHDIELPHSSVVG